MIQKDKRGLIFMVSVFALARVSYAWVKSCRQLY